MVGGHKWSSLQFIPKYVVLIPSDSDGLIKLWTIKTSECVKTLDEHADKVKIVLSVPNCS